MINATITIPDLTNEPVLSYRPGSIERQALRRELKRQLAEKVEVPLYIGGDAVTTGELLDVVCPHEHHHVLARAHQGGAAQVEQAIAAAIAAKPAWEALSWHDRAAIFLKAADLLSTRYRAILNAATMLGQSKTVHQAEIDSACELIDFLRFNARFAELIVKEQPSSAAGMWNMTDYRPLEGFVFAATPFNFTAIAANLPCAPALMGNTVVWKPAPTAMFSAYYIMQLLCAAGLPPGVINLVSGPPQVIGETALAHRDLAGVHFTGSTAVFQWMWQQIGANISTYRGYPRIVGETGGKDFIVAHPSANAEELVTAIVRGAFEYQGQKCSACSRVYIPESLYGRCKEDLIAQTNSLKMGPTTDFTNFLSAVIDAKAYAKIKGYIDHARSADDATIVAGGDCDDSEGYFIRPTIIETSNPRFKTMEEEIFGPVVTIYPYADTAFDEALTLCNSTSPYALTGAIFATDRSAVSLASQRLRHAAGNFYINDKPTGAVVGQQPFGGSRASGTNDKAGSALNLQRWISHRTVKETFAPPTDYRYPSMEEDV